MSVAILGLGEAGKRYAEDLLAEGFSVSGWDPAPRDLPKGLTLAKSNAEAVHHADFILSVNTASVSLEVAQEVAPVLINAQLYADLNTAAPERKGEVAEVVEASGARFVDVAVMARVPPKGLRTPLLVSGRGAEAFADLLSPLDVPITLIGAEPGGAATRKLLRSVAYKGVAAVVVECLETARALDLESYAREQLASILLNKDLIGSMEEGSRTHAKRRSAEMVTASELVKSVGEVPGMSLAAAEQLERLADDTDSD